jgi:MFS family permease
VSDLAGRPPPTRVVAVLCAAEVLSMTAFATFPALLPVLREAWRLTNAQAGLVSGAYFGGYMAAVPVLASLTDRVDARRVYALGATLSGLGAAGFAAFGSGLATSVAFQAVLGAGLAGTYMPGLKALSDRVEGRFQGRAVSFYTSSFGVGSSLSLLLAGLLAPRFGWRSAFAAASLTPLLAGLLVWRGLPGRPAPPAAAGAAPLFDWRGVLKSREVSSYVVGYAAHCWELFGARAWIVAFFTASAGFARWPASVWSAASLAAGINLLGPWASILGNEAAERAGRRRWISGAMAASALLSVAVGASATLAWSAVIAAVSVYYLAVMADSAALTAGVVAAAAPARRGATMAVHSWLGFAAGFAAPLAFGAALDAAGGDGRPAAWLVSFLTLGAVSAVASVVVARGSAAGGS